MISGKVAIITGAGGALGSGMVRVFSENGARVVLVDVHEDKTQAVAAQIRESGGDAMVALCDVSKKNDVDAMVASVIEQYGQIDILVNNAAIYPARPWTDIDEATWDKVFAVNIKGYFLCARAVYPHMKAVGGGKILNISSITFFLGRWDKLLDYVSTKGAVIGFTKALAREIGPDNIQVNCIAPGAFPTDAEKIHPDPEAYNQMVIDNQAIKRRGTPQDMGNAALFFVSHLSDFVTGQSILVDGGWAMD